MVNTLFIINPGSTSLKLSIFRNEKMIWNTAISYALNQRFKYKPMMDQKIAYYETVVACLNQHNIKTESFTAVISRGGPLKPLQSGTYRISQKVIKDIHQGNIQAEHVSNLGILVADEFAKHLGISAFFVDPISTDEFEPLARISGIPEIQRKSLLHTLNIKATARKAAHIFNKKLNQMNFVIAHLGGGISICPMKKGRIIDVNNSNEEGPFSPERAGSLPVSSLLQLCFSNQFTESKLKQKIVGNGGLIGYLKTSDIREVEKRIDQNDNKALLIFSAMAYQISKEIGAMATVLKGKVDAILLTGGMANSDRLISWILERVSFIAPVHIFAGENEMESLALGALRVLQGEEKEKKY